MLTFFHFLIRGSAASHAYTRTHSHQPNRVSTATPPNLTYSYLQYIFYYVCICVQPKPPPPLGREHVWVHPIQLRFDFIDSADLSDRLGVLNVVMAASPLLKPSLHAILRTDLRRSGASRKREFAARDDVENVSDPPVKEEDDSYLCVTEDDWCTSLVHECATLLGEISRGRGWHHTIIRTRYI